MCSRTGSFPPCRSCASARVPVVLVAAAIMLLPFAASASILLVHPDGSGLYPTIQDALVAAGEGDVIELTNGFFKGAGNRNGNARGKDVSIRSQTGPADSCVVDSATGFAKEASFTCSEITLRHAGGFAAGFGVLTLS